MIRFRRRHLPHLDIDGATYFITSCLAGSIPAQGLADIEEYTDRLLSQPCPPGQSEDDWQTHCSKLLFVRYDHWLDSSPVVRHFDDHRLALEACNSLYHFAGERYDLLAYVIMPSHIHWVFRPRDSWVMSLTDAERRTPRERIMHSFKTHTALRCNELLGLSGAFWQSESYDHCVRQSLELERIIAYVENNPVKAGLVASPELWPYSSARDRLQWRIPFPKPLLRPWPVGQA